MLTQDSNVVLLKVDGEFYEDLLPSTFKLELEFRSVSADQDRSQLRKKVEILVDGPNCAVLLQDTNWLSLKS